ncbi:hypothetical protein BD410DRAFT_765793 [Rickenella mellea]|uniref:Protein-S-isoprenylcysteine O-methyltransferase n=1 Tax=Rickenella mellea TaxID=50990 RepID=A0A4Y7QBX5_9AGAM|nr:hypothetical protein BD410DRAFT_765793 [Rickenella mellea]
MPFVPLRLVLLGVVVIEHHISFTPPAKATNDDQVHGSTAEWLWMLMLKILNLIMWMIFTIEATVVLAPHVINPSSTLSHVLHELCLSPSSENFSDISPLFLVGVSLSTLGTSLRIACFRSLGPLFTFTHTTRASHQLVSTGSYAIVRHPGYTAAVILRIGLLFCLFTRGGWLLGCLMPAFSDGGGGSGLLGRVVQRMLVVWSVVEAFAMILRARREDDSLHRRFGTKWEEYARRVPYRFIPCVI